MIDTDDYNLRGIPMKSNQVAVNRRKYHSKRIIKIKLARTFNILLIFFYQIAYLKCSLSNKECDICWIECMKVFKLCKTVALSFTFVGLLARLESASKCAATSLFAPTLPQAAMAKQTTTQKNRILFNCIQRAGRVNIDSD